MIKIYQTHHASVPYKQFIEWQNANILAWADLKCQVLQCPENRIEKHTDTKAKQSKTTGAVFFSKAWVPSYGHSEAHLKCPHSIGIQASEHSSPWQRLKTILVQIPM